MADEKPTLKIGTEWVDLEVTGEPTVLKTYRGYAPVLPVKDKERNFEYDMYIAAKSMADALEPLREKNNGGFMGLTFFIKKESNDKFAPYILSETKPAE